VLSFMLYSCCRASAVVAAVVVMVLLLLIRIAFSEALGRRGLDLEDYVIAHDEQV